MVKNQLLNIFVILQYNLDKILLHAHSLNKLNTVHVTNVRLFEPVFRCIICDKLGIRLEKITYIAQ